MSAKTLRLLTFIRYNTIDISIFPDKTNKPTDDDLVNCLGATYELWAKLRDIVFEMYPMAKEEWNFPGKKYGWSFRIKDKKRAIIYLLPRNNYFKVAFVYGQNSQNGDNSEVEIFIATNESK